MYALVEALGRRWPRASVHRGGLCRLAWPALSVLHTYACNRGSGQGGQATWLRSTPLNYWTTPPSQVYSILKAIATNTNTSVASTLCPNPINIDAFPGTRTRAAACKTTSFRNFKVSPEGVTNPTATTQIPPHSTSGKGRVCFGVLITT